MYSFIYDPNLLISNLFRPCQIHVTLFVTTWHEILSPIQNHQKLQFGSIEFNLETRFVNNLDKSVNKTDTRNVINWIISPLECHFKFEFCWILLKNSQQRKMNKFYFLSIFVFAVIIDIGQSAICCQNWFMSLSYQTISKLLGAHYRASGEQSVLWKRSSILWLSR